MSRCSLKTISFRRLPCESNISGVCCSSLDSSSHLRSPPESRSWRARSSRSARVAISYSSSAIVPAAEASSTSSSSSSSSSPSGRSSRSKSSSRTRKSPARTFGGGQLGAAPTDPLLGDPLLQAPAPAGQRLVDRFGRRGQTALQGGERESDDGAATALPCRLEPVGAVHLLARRSRSPACTAGSRASDSGYTAV